MMPIPDLAGAKPTRFLRARPVWPEGREEERNLVVGFRAVLAPGHRLGVVVRLTASTIYRLSVNGAFAGYGPARGPHGYFRVDEWDITPHLADRRNLIGVEVAGYNVNSYYTIDAPSFLQAEVVCEGEVLAATGLTEAPFEAVPLRQRVQKVQRYSFQRPFVEVYRLRSGHDSWKVDPDAALDPVRCGSPAGAMGLLPRRVPYPRFSKKPPLRQVSCGGMRTGIEVDRPWKDRSLVDIGPKLGGFPERELEVVLSLELQAVASVSPTTIDRPYLAEQTLRLGKNSFQILDLGTNLSGFLGATVRARDDPALHDVRRGPLEGRRRLLRLGCVNAVSYELEPGSTGRILRGLHAQIPEADGPRRRVRSRRRLPARVRQPRGLGSPLRRQRRRLEPPLRSRTRDLRPERRRSVHGLPVPRDGPAGSATASSRLAWPVTCPA